MKFFSPALDFTSPNKSIRTRFVHPITTVLLLLIGLLALSGAAHAQSTYFIDGTQDWSTLNSYSYNNFTISGNTTSSFELRFVADYQATCAIINNSDLQAFLDGESVSAYSTFNDQFGVNPVTLGQGSYSVVMRNDTNGDNIARFELDKTIDFSSNSTFYDNYIRGVTYVDANGGSWTQAFTIQSGFRYWLDGCNTGLNVYIIPASELGNFSSGGTFTYYSDYSSDSASPDEPGGYELKLPPGDYYLVARNPASIKKALQYDCSRWRLNSNNGGGGGSGGSTLSTKLDLSGNVNYSISGTSITLIAGLVSNKSTSGTSGSLRLRLFATKARYSRGPIGGYILGAYDLNPLPATYHYANLKGKVTYRKPPAGTYYLTMTLEEYTSAGWVISDFYSFSSTKHF